MGFGGVGKSGYGRHGGFEGFKAFSNKKAILVKGPTPNFVTNLLVPPYSQGFQNQLRKYALMLSTTNQSYVMFYVKLILAILIIVITKLYLMEYIWMIYAIFLKRIWPKFAWLPRLLGWI